MINQKICLKALILPAFEIGEMDDDVIGEAQLFYQAYFREAEIFRISDEPFSSSLYVKDGIGMFLLGQGKVSAAVNLTSLLMDSRFDFSSTVFIVSGCAGSSFESTVAGDVILVSSSVDFDIGHHSDIRELCSKDSPVWFPIEDYENISCFYLNRQLVLSAYELIKDLTLETTDSAKACMKRNFGEILDSDRNPQVLLGTSVAGDNYWKGFFPHNTAKQMCSYYKCEDPYAVTDMEDTAVSHVLKKFGMLDRLLIIRVSVNMDVFTDGRTPENDWTSGDFLVSADGFDGFDDLFPVAMKNEFRVVNKILEKLLNGALFN